MNNALLHASVDENTIFSRLRTGMTELTATQQVVCSYILDNFQNIPFLTVEELANACGASPASVVRTVKALEYDSYHGLQSELETFLLGTKVSLWWKLERSLDDEDNDFPMTWVAKDNILAIQETITTHLMQNYNKAVNLLLNAKNIYIVGMRSSTAAALFCYSMMNQMLSNVRLGGGSEVLYDDLVDLESGDVLLCISLGGPHHTKATTKAIRFAAQRAIPTVLIANSPVSPAAEFATVPLYIPSAQKHYSLVPCITLLEALIVSVGKGYRDSAKKKLRKLEEVLMNEDVTY